jgi:hypothetical protein
MPHAGREVKTVAVDINGPSPCPSYNPVAAPIAKSLEKPRNPAAPSLHLVAARRTAVVNVDVVARRVLAEFEEMPGMALTVRQASRLFGLEESVCRTVLDALIDLAYLRETRAGVVTLGARVAA